MGETLTSEQIYTLVFMILVEQQSFTILKQISVLCADS